MRLNMQWIQRLTMVTLAASVLCTAVLARPVQNDAEDGQSNLDKLAHQISTMRVLITKAINEGPFAERYDDAAKEAEDQARKQLAEQLSKDPDADESEANSLSEFQRIYRTFPTKYHNTRNSFTSHTRGFYADGVGVLYSTEVDVPVRQIEVDPETIEELDDDMDEWAAAADEADGRRSGLVGGVRPVQDKSTTAWVLDEAYVDDAIAGVTEKIARFGMKVTELPAGESFIVAMRCEPDSSNVSWPTLLNSQGQYDSAVSLTYSNLASVNRRGASNAKTLHVVVEIPKSLVQQFDSGSISLELFQDSVTVTKLAQKSENSWFGVSTGSNSWRVAPAPTAPLPPSGGAAGGGVGARGQSSGTGR